MSIGSSSFGRRSVLASMAAVGAVSPIPASVSIGAATEDNAIRPFPSLSRKRSSSIYAAALRRHAGLTGKRSRMNRKACRSRR